MDSDEAVGYKDLNAQLDDIINSLQQQVDDPERTIKEQNNGFVKNK